MQLKSLRAAVNKLLNAKGNLYAMFTTDESVAAAWKRYNKAHARYCVEMRKAEDEINRMVDAAEQHANDP
jgi:hypothetical protein